MTAIYHNIINGLKPLRALWSRQDYDLDLVIRHAGLDLNWTELASIFASATISFQPFYVYGNAFTLYYAALGDPN